MVDQLIPPVSGEIMARPRPQGARERGDDVVDAEFETVPPVRPLGTAPAAASGAAAPVPAVDPPAGMAMLALAAGPSGARRGGPLFWTAGAVVALAAFWIAGGHSLAPLAFAPAGAAAPAGPVRLADVRSHVERHGGHDFLYVDGALANEGAEAAPAPALEIEVRGDDGSTARYILDTQRTRIEPGERLPFSSRLDAPPGGVSGVMVTMKREGGH